MVKYIVKPSFVYLKALSILLLALMSNLYAVNVVAEPTASIDRSVIAKDDTLTFTIRSYKSNSTAPDLSPLEKNFYIVSNNQSSRFVNRNGQSESWTEWKISLIPKRLGLLKIPSIRVNGETTESLSVNVQPSIPVAAGEIRPVYIESEIDSDSVFVQQQIIYTLRIFQSIQLDNMNISEPEFDNAVLEKMGQNSFQRRILNTPYRIHELRYAIFPQETGELVIPEMVFSANEVVNQRSVFNMPGQGKLIRKTSEQHTITVKEPPVENGNSLWLPAQSITLSENWSASPDEVRVGDSITRSISINAKGLLHSQLPPTKFPKLSNANLYPDQGKSETNAEGSTTLSSRTDSVAVIPTQAGQLVLPEIRIKWWDTSKNLQQQAVIPQRVLTVKPAALNTQGSSTPLAVDHTINNTTKPAQPDNNQPPGINIWKLSTLILAIAWLVTLFFWRRQKPIIVESQEGQAVKAVNSKEKSEFKKITTVCNSNDANNARMAIVSWAKSYWPDKNIQSMEDICKHCPQQSLISEIQILNNHLYGNGGEQMWAGSQLLAIIEKVRKDNKEKTKKEINSLAPLYRN